MNSRNLFPSLCIIALLSACDAVETESLPGPEEKSELDSMPDDPVSQTSSSSTPACTEEAQDCEGDAPPCCGALFCSNEIAVYGPAVCAAPQQDGFFCVDDAHCESGICRSGICRPSACLQAGENCYDLVPDQECCEGLLCNIDPNSYGIARCMALLPVGASCVVDSECESTHCVEGLCSHGECRPEGSYCYDLLGGGSEEGPPCCEGTFCAIDPGLYGVATCTARMETGSACASNSECGSENCQAGICQ